MPGTLRTKVRFHAEYEVEVEVELYEEGGEAEAIELLNSWVSNLDFTTDEKYRDSAAKAYITTASVLLDSEMGDTDDYEWEADEEEDDEDYDAAYEEARSRGITSLD